MIKAGLKTTGIYVLLLAAIFILEIIFPGKALSPGGAIAGMLVLMIYAFVALVIDSIKLTKDRNRLISFILHLITCGILSYCFYEGVIAD